jgi:hypothetical protein
MMGTHAERERVAQAIYELDPYQESGEYVDGFAVSSGGTLSWEQALKRDAEFADVRGSLPPITKFAYDAADAALSALERAPIPDGWQLVPIGAVRCTVTGKPFGTDTWMAGRPCQCVVCKTMLAASAIVAEKSDV